MQRTGSESSDERIGMCLGRVVERVVVIFVFGVPGVGDAIHERAQGEPAAVSHDGSGTSLHVHMLAIDCRDVTDWSHLLC